MLNYQRVFIISSPLFINVNPGLINPKRLVNWGGTIKKYWMKWLLEEYPPNFHKPWFRKIRGWHYSKSTFCAQVSTVKSQCLMLKSTIPMCDTSIPKKVLKSPGKRLHSYGTSPFFMGKSTISTGPFSIAKCECLPGRVNPLVLLSFS